MAHFVRRALAGKPIVIYGDGKQVRDLLYVDDLVRVYELALTNRNRVAGEIFNIGGGPANAVSLLALVKMLGKILKHPIQLRSGPVRPGDQQYYVSDIRKAKRILGWTPKTGVALGLEKLVDWAREQFA